MVDLANTKTAFAVRTDKELRRSAFMFGFLFHPLIKSVSVFFLKLAMYLHIPIQWAVKPLIFNHFCGGETLAACKDTIEKLSASGICAIPDYSAEGLKTEEGFKAAFEEILSAITFSAGNSSIPFAVFKPSSLTPIHILEKASENKLSEAYDIVLFEEFRQRMMSIAYAAKTAGLKLLVDAEEFSCQKAIDNVVEEMMEKYNKASAIVYNTLQMYRHDRLDYLKQLTEKAATHGFFLGIKTVRGAYMEKERARAASMGYPSPINPNKATTDSCFNDAMTLIIEHIDRISLFCGTHNENSIVHLTTLMEKNNIAANDSRIWFSQLYGMSDHISYNLSGAGYLVAKYLPYGPVKLVIPYLLRRADENSSVKGQAGREWKLVKTELTRRKQNI